MFARLQVTTVRRRISWFQRDSGAPIRRVLVRKAGQSRNFAAKVVRTASFEPEKFFVVDTGVSVKGTTSRRADPARLARGSGDETATRYGNQPLTETRLLVKTFAPLVILSASRLTFLQLAAAASGGADPVNSVNSRDAFARFARNENVSRALAVSGFPGASVLPTWTFRRDRGGPRATYFALAGRYLPGRLHATNRNCERNVSVHSHRFFCWKRNLSVTQPQFQAR